MAGIFNRGSHKKNSDIALYVRVLCQITGKTMMDNLISNRIKIYIPMFAAYIKLRPHITRSFNDHMLMNEGH